MIKIEVGIKWEENEGCLFNREIRIFEGVRMFMEDRVGCGIVFRRKVYVGFEV